MLLVNIIIDIKREFMNNKSKFEFDKIYYNNITKKVNKDYKLSKKMYEDSLLLLEKVKSQNKKK